MSRKTRSEQLDFKEMDVGKNNTIAASFITPIKRYILDFIRRLVGTKYILEQMTELKQQKVELKQQVMELGGEVALLKAKVQTSQQCGENGTASQQRIEGKDAEILKRMFMGILGNQIILADTNHDPLYLTLPFDGRRMFKLEKTDAGRLCFRRPSQNNKLKKKVIINTIPKSGTHFIAKILNTLGYEDSGVFLDHQSYFDSRGVNDLSKWIDGCLASFYVDLPYSIGSRLVQPGQYALAHPAGYCIVGCDRDPDDLALIAVRDLREALISHMRMDMANSPGTIKPLQECTTKDVVDYLRDAPSAQFVMGVAKSIVAVLDMPFLRIVRFDELISGKMESMRASLKALRDVTEFSENDIFMAISQSVGKPTSTFSGGDYTRTTGIWTQEAEELFIGMGGDVLNKKLGY